MNELDGVALSFEKAKAFGAHTLMYVIYLDSGRTDLGGQQITFYMGKRQLNRQKTSNGKINFPAKSML